MIPVVHLVTPVVAALLARQPLSPSKVAFAWGIAAGPGLARAGQANLDPAGTLTVKVTGPAWAREIHRSRPILLARLRQLLGADTIKELTVTVRPEA